MTHPTTCKFCGAALVWRPVNGRDLPYDAGKGSTLRPHHTTCPTYAELLAAAKRGWAKGMRGQR